MLYTLQKNLKKEDECVIFLYIFLFILKPVKFDMFGLGQALKKNTENFLEGKLHNIDSLAKAWIANVVDK